MNFLRLSSKPFFYIILSGFVVMGLVALPLLNSALKGKEKDFNDKLFYVIAFYEEHCVRDSSLTRFIKDDGTLVQLVQTRIKKQIDSVFRKNEIPTNYVLAVGRSKTQTPTDTEMGKSQKSWAGNNLIWSGDPAYNDGLIATRLKIAYLGPAGSRIYYIKIFFPFKFRHIFRELLPLITVAVLTLSMLFFCFLMLLSIIKKQNRLAATKNDFINNMTHELNTPLFTISIASKMLAEQDIIKGNKKYASYIESIQQETGRLTKLVDKVLQTSSLEKKQFRPDKKKLDLHALIHSAVKSIDLIIQEQHAVIELSLQAADHTIDADESNIESVIFSMVDNAIKYSKGPAHITIATKNKGGTIVISFIDKGPGLDIKTKNLIFERFFRAPTGNIHDVKGYGIGLSHVKSIIEAHNGSISVKTAVGKGSEFIILLPCINHENKPLDIAG